jgi:hypothetical protein
LYRVNTLPYFAGGLSSNPNYYYGVFTANGATTAKYTATYTYAYTNGVVNAVNELNASLRRRNDNSVTTWVNAAALLDTSTNRLIKKNYLGRSEFIFNISTPNGNRSKFTERAYSRDNISLSIVPNPATYAISLSGIAPDSPVYVVDLTGHICALYNPASNKLTIDVSQLAPGVYIIKQIADGKLKSAKFIKQ